VFNTSGTESAWVDDSDNCFVIINWLVKQNWLDWLWVNHVMIKFAQAFVFYVKAVTLSLLYFDQHYQFHYHIDSKFILNKKK